ncbi:hypothetical protein [Mycoplasma sp. SG1]|uniref:hypothetical protein n=1 Tax=Mycoplasma sp. SG1 TaxID=2810348 RepID=UPI002024C8AE|nr:hypothetical protein [Mycoplasma sp. SG1]URM52799.1 hypothetical protein JRW51_00430 [Mycoplasma sp. SG1]
MAAKDEINQFKDNFVKVVTILIKYKVSKKNLLSLIIINGFSHFNLNKITMIKSLEQIYNYAEIVINKDKSISWDLVQEPIIVMFDNDLTVSNAISQNLAQILGFNWEFK